MLKTIFLLSCYNTIFKLNDSTFRIQFFLVIYEFHRSISITTTAFFILRSLGCWWVIKIFFVRRIAF